ncbi:MAG: translation initiation factor IF-2 subunit beta [Candidatus Aenigmarchaeota archaeon]|nr:translation initiation factor IF-2 subunit beta [Candidatus Aenigmarchaeota archaeon]
MTDMEYEELLKMAKSRIPKGSETTERFSIPKPVVVQSGKQTIVQNFNEICKTMRRDAKHVSKFLFKELAVPGSMKDGSLVLQGKFRKDIIEKRIDEYAKNFLYCLECGKADTNLQKTDRMYTLKCESCGAKKTLK